MLLASGYRLTLFHFPLDFSDLHGILKYGGSYDTT